ncbi:MAG: helix-turn-helix domain-containing protein [Ktedonobacteraceae bacterium]
MSWSRLDSITLRKLHMFCVVARLLNSTRAAEELGCRLPTVSALVAELERVTQLPLLEQWSSALC